MCPLDKKMCSAGFSEVALEHREPQGTESQTNGEPDDLRGRMHRVKRMMPDLEVRQFLQAHKVAHVGTVDANGWPYVVPLVYIYEGGDLFYLHTGDHKGHFLTNVQQNPRICVEVGEMGQVHRGRPFACNSALVYTSAVIFGPVRILEDRAKKEWFFDRLMAKYGEAGWTFEPGYPQINRIILYEQKMEIVTGKHSSGLYH
jgi:nitroimidazol reductase NimA-like FMN-containing flavoprotein (pyridoxamine 5'-phosphate oxidase superfamily)